VLLYTRTITEFGIQTGHKLSVSSCDMSNWNVWGLRHFNCPLS